MLGLGSALTTGSTKEQLYSLGELDGTDDYLHIGVVPGVKGLRDITVSAWVKTNEASLGNFDRIVSCDGGTGNNIWRLFISSNSGNKGVIWNCFNGDGDSIGLLTTSDVWGTGGNDDKWVHVVARIDASASPKTSIFINGGTPTTGTANQSDEDMRNEAATQLSIGAQGDGGNYWFPGFIDDVAIWNVPLSNDAVDAIYNGGKPFDLNNNRGDYSNSSALVGYWRMGNGTFDDKANGVVHDAHNPGFGSELVSSYQVTATSSTSGTLNTSNTSNVIGGAGSDIKFTNDSGNVNGIVGTAMDLVLGKTYQYSFSYKVNNGTLRFKIADSGTVTGGTNATGNGANDNLTSATDAVYSFAFRYTDANQTNYMTWFGNNGVDFQISNVTCRELNGFPGLTQAAATFSADTPDD